MTAIPHHIDREHAGRVYQFPIVRMRCDRPRRRAWPLTLAVLVGACLLGTGAGMCGNAPQRQEKPREEWRQENGHPTPNPKG